MTSENLRNVELEDDVWNEADYPPPYSATTVKNEEDREIGFRREYLFSVEGALKCIEIVLSLIAFVAVMAGGWSGSGFVAWTTISAFITTTIIFFIVGFNIYTRFPFFWVLYELIYCILYALKYFISAIIAGVGASLMPSIVAVCAFCAAGFFVYLLDAMLIYRKVKAIREEERRKREAGEHVANRRSDNSFCIIF
ncbi:uncharacterized protein LOC128243306 isoform X3 [Mya arenaria]|uniref:uncharacterized protein LOC128243306 isoform X1 n=1 Tax=Mya arenaria TaxID=6604 RepID=UPI0022E3AF68|nr:uncharacterized protein LOC128243306 isoform X1 [Mya arenaria]XP_052816965.1 uncharacterized protein LOC128243306 isoform X2 [Mya arenaria]XP_052816966.1 uncharacterized protein LOC128243306 isoform X3 [Mya arenaria]